ncbi:MAG TPA: VCBS repeat-containing protein, partial [Gemmataceae bacterium]
MDERPFPRRRRGATAAVRQLRKRLALERLEDRLAPATLHVAPGGADAAGRGSPSDPFRTIQFAADQAQNGDEIRVAAGTYTYDASVDIHGPGLGTRQVLTVFNKRLTILGGFSASDFSARNPAANVTVIDGQGQFRGVMVVGFTEPTGLTLDGFTIQNGLATGIPGRQGLDSIYAFGGGVFVDGGNQPDSTVPFVFRNLTFRNNVAQGSDNTTVSFDGSGGVIGGNAAGGAVALRFARDVTMENVVFEGNESRGGTGGNRGGAALGAAVHVNESNLTGTNLTFRNNRNFGGDTAGSGTDAIGEEADALGAALAVQFNSTVVLSNVTADGNRSQGGAAGGAGGRGGGAFGGAFFAEAANLTITDAVLTNNVAEGGPGFRGGIVGGGAVQTGESNLTLERVKLVGNSAIGGPSSSPNGEAGPTGGGAVYATQFRSPGVRVTITNTLIAGNAVRFAAGFGSHNAGGGGGGVWLQGVQTDLTHVTLADNLLGPDLFFGDALLLISDGTTPTVASLAHSIVANHTSPQSQGAVFVRTPETLNINGLLYSNNTDDDNRDRPDGPPFAPGTFNGANTILTVRTAGFTSPGPADFDYSLLANSPARGAARGSTTPTDIGNNPRDDVPDLGAYEFGTPGGAPVGSTATGANTPNAPVPPPPPPAGGTDARRQLLASGPAGSAANLYDFPGGTAQLKASFTPFPGAGSASRAATGDVNGDGVVDFVFGAGPGSSNLRVTNGATGTDLVPTFATFEPGFTGGIFIATGDIDGDGTAEVVVSPDVGGGGRIQIFRFNGSALEQADNFFGIEDLNFRGGARVALADVNGDGRLDLAVGAGFGGGPRVAVFDGQGLLQRSSNPPKLVADFFAFPGIDAVTLRNG